MSRRDQPLRQESLVERVNRLERQIQRLEFLQRITHDHRVFRRLRRRRLGE